MKLNQTIATLSLAALLSMGALAATQTGVAKSTPTVQPAAGNSLVKSAAKKKHKKHRAASTVKK